MAQSGFTEEHCVGTVLGYGPFVQPLEGREGIRKFGINFQLEVDPDGRPPEKSENYGKTLMFETKIGLNDSPNPTDAQKKRIMEAFEALKYDPKQGLMSEEQKKRVLGAKARVKVQRNQRGHWEVGFVDALDAPRHSGSGRYDPFEHKLDAQAEEDFCSALDAFGREKLGVTEPIEPASRWVQAPSRPAAGASVAGRAAAPAPATTRAPAQRPQRQANPDVAGDDAGGDDEIPF